MTVFAPGLGGGIPDTRPLGSGVRGRRVFFAFPGRSSYAGLAEVLRAVADEYGATRVLGVSLGAGALCRLLADTPDRFERVAFFLPAALDRPNLPVARERLAGLLAALRAGDRAALVAALAEDAPEDAGQYIGQRADELLRTGLAPEFADVLTGPPVPDRAVLGKVTAPALVLGCRGDERHPARTARELAAALPSATLHIYDRPHVLWAQRADLRDRISAFLQ